MKKLLAVVLILLLSLEVIAQEDLTQSVFREISESFVQTLSSKEQLRFQRLKQSDDFLSVTLIKVESLQQAIKKENLTFDLPNVSGKIIANTKNIDYSINNNFTWNGTFSNGEAFIIHENGRTYGQIRSNGAVFDIQYLENGYAILIEYNMDKLNLIDCGFQDEQIEKSNIKSSQINKSGNDYQENQAAKIPSSSPLIRALVLYTPNAQATGLNMSDLANTARGQWVTAQINSSVQSNLEIAGVVSLSFNENSGGNNISQDVQALRNNITAQQLRDQFEADIVLLFTDGNYGSIGGIVADIGPVEEDAYAIVEVANATSTVTFAHEAAHLFGARHDSDPTPGDAHGHGWKDGFWPFLDKYGSIMRVIESGRERVLYFSNPYRTHKGEATGVLNTRFNARVINVNGQIVEDFRYTQPDFTVSISGPGSANDGDALSFFSSTYNGPPPYTYTWKADIGNGYFTVGSSSTLNYTMPTDKDLNISLTVTDGNNQQATDGTFVRNLFLDGGPCTECPDNLDSFIEETTIASEQILLYPNPTFNLLKIILPTSFVESSFTFQIADLKGAIISEKSNIRNKQQLQTIDVSMLKQGMYVLRVTGNGTIQTIKFIKK